MTDTSGDSEYKTSISAPKPIELGFAWWVLVVWLINISVFGVIIWRVLVIFLPKRKKKVKVIAGGAGDTAPSEYDPYNVSAPSQDPQNGDDEK